MPATDPADPLHDVLLSLTQAGMDEALVRKTLEPVRQRWQGACYIRSRDPGADAEIERRIEAGEPMKEIAKAAGVHRSTISRRRSKWLSSR